MEYLSHSPVGCTWAKRNQQKLNFFPPFFETTIKTGPAVCPVCEYKLLRVFFLFLSLSFQVLTSPSSSLSFLSSFLLCAFSSFVMSNLLMYVRTDAYAAISPYIWFICCVSLCVLLCLYSKYLFSFSSR